MVSNVSRAFLDALSGQPLHPAAASALRAAEEYLWADPAAPYYEGARARQLSDAARETVAIVIGVSASRISFRRRGADAALAAIAATMALPSNSPPVTPVSGSSPAPGPLRPIQADPRAETGWSAETGARAETGWSAETGWTVVTSAVERMVVLEAAAELGGRPTEQVGVDSQGRVSLKQLRAALAGPKRIAVIQAANTELGTVQPLRKVIESTTANRTQLVVDATAALGIIEIPTGWTSLFADAVGWAGPSDTAVVVAPAGRTLPDTVGLSGILATAMALDSVHREAARRVPRLLEMTGRIRAFPERQLPDAFTLGPAQPRLPQVVALSIPYLDASMLQSELDRAGIAVGSGSACANRTGEPSHVLRAAGLITSGNLRVTIPWSATDESISRLLLELPTAVARVAAQINTQLDDQVLPITARPTAGSEIDLAIDIDRANSAAASTEAVLTIDAIGLRCPGPVVKLNRAARDHSPSILIELLSDDPGTHDDIESWCQMNGAELLSQKPLPGVAGGEIHLVRSSSPGGGGSTGSGITVNYR